MNQVASWTGDQNVESLMHMEGLLGNLHQVLSEELQAVGRFDFELMKELDVDKRRLVEEIEDAAGDGNAASTDTAQDSVQATPRSSEEAELAARVSLAAEQVRAMIHANSALLGEAIKAIAAKLGLDLHSQAYDRRARSVAVSRYPSSKSI